MEDKLNKFVLKKENEILEFVKKCDRVSMISKETEMQMKWDQNYKVYGNFLRCSTLNSYWTPHTWKMLETFVMYKLKSF